MNLQNKPKVLAATYNPISNTKMISFLVDFPTVLLAELRTHRILTQGSLYEHSELNDFNLSANSARAIPHSKYLEKVLDNPFIPIWTKQQKGMGGELICENIDEFNAIWLDNLERSSFDNELSNKLIDNYHHIINWGAHKQNANRLLAPFAYTTCIISGTNWDNFFELRCPKYLCIDGEYYKSKKDWWFYAKLYHGYGAENIQEPNWDEINKSTTQPEFQVISEMLYDLYQEADWKKNKVHIPFEDEIDKLYKTDIENHVNENKCGISTFTQFENSIKIKMKISASMCAKLSYNTQDNEDTLEKHLERANMLIEHKHQEPFSHQAIAMDSDKYKWFYKCMLKNINGVIGDYIEYGWCYNLIGFISQRYIIENDLTSLI